MTTPHGLFCGHLRELARRPVSWQALTWAAHLMPTQAFEVFSAWHQVKILKKV
jgi:hypothetical protein